MRPVSVILFAVVSLAALVAQADDAPAPPLIGSCTPPEAPTIPDGETAAASELKAANAGVKAFMAAGTEYTDCLDDHEESLGDEIADEEASALITAHNAMVDQMSAVAEEFNTALSAYRAKKAAASSE